MIICMRRHARAYAAAYYLYKKMLLIRHVASRVVFQNLYVDIKYINIE